MRGLGIRMMLGATPGAVSRTKEGISCEITLPGEDGKPGEKTTVTSEKLLFAAGRSGRSEELGLESLGVAVDKRGYVQVDHDYRTNVPSIYAAGDVIGFPALASTSMEQARVAVCHAFDFAYKRQVSNVIPYGVYTIPEVSCVGLSEEAAKEQKVDYVVGRAYYRDNARGKIVGDKDGVVKLLFHRTERKLLGCHCIGDRASELVHIGQTALMLGGTVDSFIEMVFNYPTLSETFKYAAYDALGRFATKSPTMPPALGPKD